MMESVKKQKRTIEEVLAEDIKHVEKYVNLEAIATKNGYNSVEQYLKAECNLDSVEQYIQAKRNDAMFCFGMGLFYLENLLPIWSEKEKEYLANPIKFEDVSQYDSKGRVYLDHVAHGVRIYMPNYTSHEDFRKDLESNDELLTLDEIYESLPFHALDCEDLKEDNIYILLGVKKFVREIRPSIKD